MISIGNYSKYTATATYRNYILVNSGSRLKLLHLVVGVGE